MENKHLILRRKISSSIKALVKRMKDIENKLSSIENQEDDISEFAFSNICINSDINVIKHHIERIERQLNSTNTSRPNVL
jgi:archaellum component FlaC